MKVQHIIGADLSKKTIDLVCHLSNDHICIENSVQGFKQMLKWVRQQKIDCSQTMVVMEHTGLYSFCFESFLHCQGICFTKVNALASKRSLGMIRGKSDKLDAERIAIYGNEKKDRLRADKPLDEGLKRLQMLYATRLRIVKQRTALTCAVREYKHVGILQKDLIIQAQIKMIKVCDTQIKHLAKEIKVVIEQHQTVKQNFSLLQSVKGVGEVLACAMILKTHNFQLFENARKFACFCGIAPFEYTSGTSIKRKARVSQLADKRMKSLLDLSAKSAIQYDKELREYYLKRTQNGKSKMSTINVVRNKILYRMFAVIKRQTPFLEDYLNAA